MFVLCFVSTSVEAQNLLGLFKKENQNVESGRIYQSLRTELDRVKDFPDENQGQALAQSDEILTKYIEVKKEECAKLKEKKTCHQELVDAVEKVMDKLTDAKKDFLEKTHKRDVDTLERLKTDFVSQLKSSLK